MITNLNSVNFTSATKKSEKNSTTPSFKGTLEIAKLSLGEFDAFVERKAPTLEKLEKLEDIMTYVSEQIRDLVEKSLPKDDRVKFLIKHPFSENTFRMEYDPGEESLKQGIYKDTKEYFSFETVKDDLTKGINTIINTITENQEMGKKFEELSSDSIFRINFKKPLNKGGDFMKKMEETLRRLNNDHKTNVVEGDQYKITFYDNTFEFDYIPGPLSKTSNTSISREFQCADENIDELEKLICERVPKTRVSNKAIDIYNKFFFGQD